MVPVLILLLGKKLRLKRLELLGAATEEESELFVLPWRSWSCIRPCSCLVENNGPCCEWCSSNNDWFVLLFMKKAEEGIDCGECPNEDWFRGGIKCSNFVAAAPTLLPRRKMLLVVAVWFCFWTCESWLPTWDRLKLVVWFVPNKWVPREFKPLGNLALSCASASQKALWVMKLSRLHKKYLMK